MMSRSLVTLQEMLDARERRSEKISRLTECYKASLLVAKLNIPGPEKDHQLYRDALLECKKELLKRLYFCKVEMLHEEMHFYQTGAELYMVVDMNSHQLKEICMEIEENHFLGRLFDIDIQDASGVPVSRTSFGKNVRSCLVCDADAYQCARSRKHDLETVVNKIQRMITSYFNE